MKRKPWQLDRREMLRGSGIALALPFLDSMAWARGAESKELPKRLVATYFHAAHTDDFDRLIPEMLMNFLNAGHGDLAGTAPRCPKIHDHDAAAKCRQVDNLAGRRFQRPSSPARPR